MKPDPSPRILHILSQRPGMTGSGVTLDALVRNAESRGWDQRVIVASAAGDAPPEVGGLPAHRIDTLLFETDELPFALPGMSDVMPYPSTRFGDLDDDQLALYKGAWRAHIGARIRAWRPDLIHVHHIWIVASLIKDIAPDIPVVNQCHATGFRQMGHCSHLAIDVREGCRRNDTFIVLNRGHISELRRILDVERERIFILGAGYDEQVFNFNEADPQRLGRIIYVGKLSDAKGLPSLLDAVERLGSLLPSLELHVVGSGAGPRTEVLRRRMTDLGSRVVQHGQISQRDLAVLMRTCAVCVLPSFYEGVPLVLVEALACGCRLVSTRLPGIVEQLEPACGDLLEMVDSPRLLDIDNPLPADLPAFTTGLVEAIARCLAARPLEPDDPVVTMVRNTFSWREVFRHVEGVWLDLLESRQLPRP